jgi:hypothetical protein
MSGSDTPMRSNLQQNRGADSIGMRRRPARPNGLLRSAPDAGNDDVEPALTRPFPAELDHLEEEHRVPLRFVSQIQDRTNDPQRRELEKNRSSLPSSRAADLGSRRSKASSAVTAA